jgi:ribonucleoside-diphosphate reductase alpha chain
MTDTQNPEIRIVAGKGLTMQRLYTTEGVHPYDEVTWESRDVVQTNWKTGETVFQQRGVEFPDFWSVNASTIVTTKYFRGALGTEARERSLKQLLDRVVLTYVRAGKEHGYFATDEDAAVFEHELTWMLLHQVFSFNSPVWFNVGTSSPQQVSACFILAVDDTMTSILNWYREEGLIFKGGSGAGLNLSRIRSSKELLSSGGTASGPVSFMRGADASAGTIKSGGATRRAAKMVVLDVDHPDIEEFIETKKNEENKIRALRDAGFDMDLGGKDITSVQYQNANNSVRVNDEFMHAVENGGQFGLKTRSTGEVIDTVDARELFRKISEAAWACADPGVQYDDTINDWHTNPETGRITASNPCFTGDTLVHTDKGLIRFDELVGRANVGEEFQIWTHDATNNDERATRAVLTTPEAYLITGYNNIVRLRFANGMELTCTPGHKIWTENRGYVEAENLTDEDRILALDVPTPAVNATDELPASALVDTRAFGERHDEMSLPTNWSFELAHYLGWLIGDGSTSSTISTIYGSAEDRAEIMPLHQNFIESINGGRALKISEQSNGTAQLRLSRGAFRRFLEGLGVTKATSSEKVVPSAIYQAPPEIVAAFLQGLFDADGTVIQEARKGSYVSLGSVSVDLLRDTQRLLSTFGIGSRIYKTKDARKDGYRHTRPDGSVVTYDAKTSYQLRIANGNIEKFASVINFRLSRKAGILSDIIVTQTAYHRDQTTRMVERTDEGIALTYNLSEPRNHSYVANGIVVRNCSEYMSLDNSSCNLASLNLLKFLKDDDTFDAATFAKAVEFIITAMDISICFADFPTEPIADTTRKYRQLGIGYANLGALLMATGLPYDSDGGRALAAAITSLMTGTAYKRSAELAGVVGPYEGFARNAQAHARVMRKHAAATDAVRSVTTLDSDVLKLAAKAWAEGNEIGAKNGWRNAQASVLAPTGCLTGDTLVTTDRGLVRLSEIGDVWGERWQDVDLQVSTDEGSQIATKFFVNGEEPTRRIVTEGGYRIQGTLAHRIKVVDSETQRWVWKRLADVAQGDVVPLQSGTLVGGPVRVPLPVLDQAYYAGDRNIEVPDHIDASLAELVGYFMGDGSLHAKGIRLCVADTDLDVIERIRILSKELFHLEPVVRQEKGYHEVTLQSMRLARWWQAAGFAKDLPGVDHSGKGWTPRVPAAIRETNDATIYAAFARGVFEADGTVLQGVPSVSTASEVFADDLRTLLLALGLPTTTRETVSGWGGAQFQVRVRTIKHAITYSHRIGFMSDRKNRLIATDAGRQAGNRDRIQLPDEAWNRLVPVGHELRRIVQQAISRGVGVSRDLARKVFATTGDAELAEALGYIYETVAANEDGGVQPTYDLSVPSNVTYVANGMVSHNTIGFMMDCDTTGIEPDFSLVKFKKLVGGGSMQIVNQTIPRALRKLGYEQETIEAIVEYIDANGHVIDAPGLKPEHYAVFDTAMGERAITPMGHVRMMAAAQPFLSGAISKTVNMPESATVEDVEEIYLESWKLGLKALAIYRDNCKVGQPLSDGVEKKSDADAPVEARPTRKRLPKKRPSQTVSFSVGGAEGYMTAGSYPDDGLGEVFLKLGKQGSTLAGVMDAFSIAISIALQYGVPLEAYTAKFVNMRFEPAGMTDDPDIRMAQSVMDYIFRRLALDYLPYEKRSALGIFTAEERAATVAATSYGSVPAASAEEDFESLAQSAPIEKSAPAVTDEDLVEATATPAPAGAHSSAELLELITGKTADSPLCMTCGIKMRPAGSCYVCEGCGSTSGCS